MEDDLEQGLSSPLRARALLLIACHRWLLERGALEPVLERLGPATRSLLTDPPVRTAWLPCEPFEEVYRAIAYLHGVEALRELGFEATRDSLARTILRPILSVVAAFGTTPARMFSRLNLSIRASMRGVTTVYRSASDTSGVVLATYARPLPPMIQQVSLGSLRYVYEVCQVEGTVTLLGVESDGCVARIGVQWEPRKAR